MVNQINNQNNHIYNSQDKQVRKKQEKDIFHKINNLDKYSQKKPQTLFKT